MRRKLLKTVFDGACNGVDSVNALVTAQSSAAAMAELLAKHTSTLPAFDLAKLQQVRRCDCSP